MKIRCFVQFPMSMVLLRVLGLMVVMLRVPDSLNGYSNKRHITIV